MGVYLPNMEMPTKGYRLILINADGTAQSTDGETTAVPVPKHGRCIDADALTISTAVPLDGKPYQYVHIDNIKAAPTIIPADKNINIQKEFLQNWHEEGDE